jgi:hypothetical protein
VDADWELLPEVDGGVWILTARDSPWATALGSHLGHTWAESRTANEDVGDMFAL